MNESIIVSEFLHINISVFDISLHRVYRYLTLIKYDSSEICRESQRRKIFRSLIK